MGVLVGGLGVTVVGLVVAVVVLAMGGSSDSPTVVGVPAPAKHEPAPHEKEPAASEPKSTPAAAHPGPDNAPMQFLQTPSGNIACSISSTEARCDIEEKDWTPYIPKPASCHLDWGNSVAVGAYGPSEFLCVGDTLLGSAEGEVPYGYAVTRGRIECVSRESGLTCMTPAGTGFFLSKERVKLL